MPKAGETIQPEVQAEAEWYGQELRRLRLAAGVSVQALASATRFHTRSRTPVSGGSVNNIERGSYATKFETVEVLFLAFGYRLQLVFDPDLANVVPVDEARLAELGSTVPRRRKKPRQRKPADHAAPPAKRKRKPKPAAPTATSEKPKRARRAKPTT